jgi:competence protein ComEC
MVSKSRVFLFLMLSFLGGVAFSSFFGFSLFWVLFLVAVLAVFLFSLGDKRNILFSIILSSLFIFGMYWYKLSIPENLALQKYSAQNVELNVYIKTDPEFKDTKQQFIAVTEDKEKILINTKRYPEYVYGDRLLLEGKLKEPENFKDFNYKTYLAKDNIYFLMNNPKIILENRNNGSVILSKLFLLKKSFQENIKILLPSPESDLINGILFGSKSELPKDLYNNFINTGTAHIIALSGFNVTIIVMFVAWIFGYLVPDKRIVVISAIAVITLFVIMTGASSSVVRAAIMGSVLLLAKYYGRAQHALNALIFAALLMVLINPKVLVFDVSFQLSFLATLGLLYIYPYFLEKFKKVPDIFKLRDTMSATFAAQIAVLPILLFNFKQISIISPLVNVLILPAIPIAMFFGFFTGLFAFIFLPLAKLLAFILWFILFYQISIINFFGNLSFSILNFN